jgi:ferric iron reductase protein FhuF
MCCEYSVHTVRTVRTVRTEDIGRGRQNHRPQTETATLISSHLEEQLTHMNRTQVINIRLNGRIFSKTKQNPTMV